MINISRRNSLQALTGGKREWTFSEDALLQSLQTKGGVDECGGAVGRHARLMTEEAKPFDKYSSTACTTHLWKGLSKQEAALTARGPQEAFLLIRWPSPTEANASKDACGLPPSESTRRGSPSEEKRIHSSHLKGVVSPEPECIIRLEFLQALNLTSWSSF